jgi:NAD(P)-dependent dehydrogenase (short-subunit alcohol dehydrogenase family)
MGSRRIKEAIAVKDKVVLVTGAAGKLGTSLCRSLVTANRVIAAYHTRPPDIPSQLRWPAVRDSKADNNRAWCVQANVSEPKDIRRLVEVSLARHGRIDVVINAGADTRYHGRVTDLCYDRDMATTQLAINAIAPFALVSEIFHEAWKHERESNAKYNRNVINLSSFAGMYVQDTKGQAFYGASKAALNLLTLHLALELAPYAIRVNALCPPRFPDTISTERVVAQIVQISDGSQTGEIVELSAENGRSASD